MDDIADKLGCLSKLEQAGLDSAYDVVARSTTDLHSVLRDASHVNAIVDAASKEVYPWRSRIKTAQSLPSESVSTGDPTMDRILGGSGIPLGSLTEIVGESASGKTQLALQLCLAVQDPNQLHGEAVYLHSEGRFPSIRLDQLATSFAQRYDILPEQLEKAIHTMRLTDRENQYQALVYQLPALLSRRRNKVRVVVIDSISAIYRGEQEKNQFERMAEVCDLGLRLKRIASQYQVAIVAINQVSDVFTQNKDKSSSALPPELVDQWIDFRLESASSLSPAVPLAMFWQSLTKKPVLGMSWSNAVSTRIRLARSAISSSNGSTRRALFIEFSPTAPRSGCEIIIDMDGVKAKEWQ